MKKYEKNEGVTGRKGEGVIGRWGDGEMGRQSKYLKENEDLQEIKTLI